VIFLGVLVLVRAMLEDAQRKLDERIPEAVSGDRSAHEGQSGAVAKHRTPAAKPVSAKSAVTGWSERKAPATTVREHLAASRASRELARRERAKMRDIKF